MMTISPSTSIRQNHNDGRAGGGIRRPYWLETGDRSHPNLQKLDRLFVSYPGWEIDFRAAEDAHIKGSDFDTKLFKLEETQRVYANNDRSHCRLIELDSLQLSYPGWEEDWKETETYHLTHGESFCADFSFKKKVEGMRNKQQMYVGDRSHPNLVRLDKLRFLTYPGWEKDFHAAEVAHRKGSYKCNDAIHRLEEKERVYRGDRSHWRLIKLDSLDLSYPGCEKDAKAAEEYHLTYGEDVVSNLSFEKKIEGMRNKQQMFLGDRSHPNLQRLDELNLSYPNWRDDFQAAETAHKRGICFNDKLHMLKEKQRVYDGHRTHWRLEQLDSLKLSYPEWRKDFKDAEEYHFSHGEDIVSNLSFERKLDGMKNKQSMFLGTRKNHPNILTSNSTNTGITTRTLNKCAETPTNLGLCIVCFAEPKAYAFVPCGHLSLCEKCTFASMDRSACCPICRQPAEKAMKVFVC